MMTVLLALLAVAILAMVKTSAQEPRFPRSCCGEYDCLLHPVPRTQLERQPDGWFLLKEKILIPFNQARRSPDKGVYICRTQAGHGVLIEPKDELPCLFIPDDDG